METENSMKTGKMGLFHKIWSLFLPLLVFYTVYVISYMLLSFCLRNVASGLETGKWASSDGWKATLGGVINGVSMLAGALVLVPVLRVELREHCDSVAVHADRNVLAQKAGMILITILLAFSSSIGLNILLTLSGFVQSSSSYQEVAQSQYGVAFGVGIILYAMVSPVAEEIVFRGVIYNRMRHYLREYSSQKHGRCDMATVMAIVASGVLFGVYHGNMVQGVYGGCMGILMAYLYERTHAFYIPCLFHGAANCAVYLLAQNAALHDWIFTVSWCGGLLGIAFILILIVEKMAAGEREGMA